MLIFGLGSGKSNHPLGASVYLDYLIVQGLSNH